MKLPIEAQSEYLFDADGLYVGSVGGSFSLSSLDAHARQIARAVNHHDALVAALEGTIEIAQAAIVAAHGRNEYPAIIANLEMKESAARAALAAAKGEA